MIKILHTGDFHLDSAYRGLSGEAALARRRGQRELLHKIVALGNEEGVDLLLLAGDLLDGKNAYFETVHTLADALSESHARVFLAPGNHDAFTADSPYRSVRFPSNVHIFKSPRVEKIELPELDVCVYGAGFTSPQCDESLLSGFRADENMMTIMLLHGNIKGNDCNPVREAEIKDSGLSYLALGHIHQYSGIKTAGKTTYAYSGCPEGRGFDETGDKGILIGTISKNKVDLEFRTVSEYRYMERAADLTGANSIENAILSILPQNTEKETCRLTLNGICDKPDTQALYELLSGRFYGLNIRDRTESLRPLWYGEDDGGLRGIFLCTLHKSYDAEQDEVEWEKIIRAAEFGIAAFENRDLA